MLSNFAGFVFLIDTNAFEESAVAFYVFSIAL
jgi:hypothetical protein